MGAKMAVDGGGAESNELGSHIGIELKFSTALEPPHKFVQIRRQALATRLIRELPHLSQR